MRYKTLFRVLLKVLGVSVIVGGISGFFGQIAYFSYVVTTPSRMPEQWWFHVLNMLAPVLQLAIGLYLFLGGKWIADKAIPGNRPYCHECGYDLTNAAGNLCSECGTPFKPAAEMSSAP